MWKANVEQRDELKMENERLKAELEREKEILRKKDET